MNQPATMPRMTAAAIPIPTPAFAPMLSPLGGDEVIAVVDVDVDSVAKFVVCVSEIVEKIDWVELVVSAGLGSSVELVVNWVELVVSVELVGSVELVDSVELADFIGAARAVSVILK